MCYSNGKWVEGTIRLKMVLLHTTIFMKEFLLDKFVIETPKC